jgi:5S rRNA maturation endonuclease (ribonuclease M5)
VTIEDFLERFSGPRRQNGNGVDVRCPAHEDKTPSLSVAEGDDGRILLNCKAGCETEAVVTALGLTMADLYPEKRATDEIVATYDYVSETGELLFQVVRRQGKRFSQRRPNGSGGWIYKLGDTRRVLYRLPLVLAAVKGGHRVYIAEGEKDVSALETAGVVATCNPGGAGKWRDEYAEALRGASEVVIVADKDEPGRAHAEAIAASLKALDIHGRKRQARTGHDASDHLAAGHTVDQFVPLDPAPKAASPDDLAREFVLGAAMPTYMPAGHFDALDFPTPEPYLGTNEHLVLFRGCLAMIFGDEGAGKTTALIDLAAHTAAGLPWLDLPVPRPLRWLLIENESSPGMFQRQLREKREHCDEDPSWFDNIHVQGGEGIWGTFTFRHEAIREGLLNYCRKQRIDMVGVNPTFGVGGPGAGKPDETQGFVDNMLRPVGLWNDVGFLLLHHENKSGQISGDWGRQPDTVIQLERDGDLPRTKLIWTKLRHSRELGERPKRQLLDWVPEHKGFTVSDAVVGGKVSDEELFERLDIYLQEHPRQNTRTVRTNVRATARDSPSFSAKAKSRGATRRRPEAVTKNSGLSPATVSVSCSKEPEEPP